MRKTHTDVNQGMSNAKPRKLLASFQVCKKCTSRSNDEMHFCGILKIKNQTPAVPKLKHARWVHREIVVNPQQILILGQLYDH